ncbi:MAG: hypothetical protein GX298_03905 [Planctomycetes bacterium]|nr:hypothetical protein [Planctomycetota bacterium]
MAGQNRTVAVLFALLAAMTVGAMVLMTLDQYAPGAGAYSLSSYLRLDPVEQVVKNTLQTAPAQWDGIEVFYSRTRAGNVDELPLLISLSGGQAEQFHFLVCNGNGAEDGHIQTTPQWRQQAAAEQSGTIRICVVGDSRTPLTNSQIQRTNDLVENLSRTFNIGPRRIRYPANW